MLLPMPELENRVREVVEQARTAEIESSKFEIKAVWLPNHEHAASRLAAHANAARGAPITWIMGVVEKGGANTVRGVVPEDMSDWLAQVKSHFEDQHAPELLFHLTPMIDGETVVAMHFATDQPPYVIVEMDKDGKKRKRVLWREGTAAGDATRAQLLRILVKQAAIPPSEVLICTVNCHVMHQTETKDRWEWKVAFDLWMTPSSRVTFPFYKCRASIDATSQQMALKRFVVDTRDCIEAAAVDAPHKLRIEAFCYEEVPRNTPFPGVQAVTARLSLEAAEIPGAPIVHSVSVPMTDDKPHVSRVWRKRFSDEP